MKNKRLVVTAAAVPLLAILGYFGVRWLAPSSHLKSTTDTTEQTSQSQSHSRAKHQTKPSADLKPSNVPWAELKDDDSWIVYYNDLLELAIQGVVQDVKRKGITFTPEELEEIREQLARQFEPQIAAARAAGEEIPAELPKLSDAQVQSKITKEVKYDKRGKLHEARRRLKQLWNRSKQ